MKRLLTATLFALVMMVFLSCSTAPKPVMDQEDFGLARVSDQEELTRLLQADKNNSIFSLFGDIMMTREGAMEDDAVGAPDESQDAGMGGDEHSQTNVQVEGIDEGDIIKTDGNRIYSLAGNRLHVIDILGNGEMSVAMVNELDRAYGSWYSELYITDDYLIVIGAHYDYAELHPDAPQSDAEDVDGIRPWVGYGWGLMVTRIELYDIESLELSETFEISGSLMTSRLIDDHLYLISNHNVPYQNNDVDPRPFFKHGDETITPEYTDIKYLPGMPYRSFTVISHIHLDASPLLEYDIFLGNSGWGNFYVSRSGIYLATILYEQTPFGRWNHYGKLISYLIEEDGSVSYGGAGRFEGHVLNQFSMDEYNGYFRMFTTEGWGDDVINRLYVFERKVVDGKRILEVVGLIDEGLGKPRETIRSARFMGDRATVVTFEMIDPFYVIDLSDPYNPTILGELEIPGFSTYQHPWTDDLVLGIGYESDGIGVDGIKLALYDISDEENPVEVGKPLVMLNKDHGWQFGEALHNHKAILVSKPFEFIGFSIYRYHWFSSNYHQTNDYMIFSIDPEREYPIEIAATLSHFDLYEADEDFFRGFGAWRFGVDRAVTIGEHLYVVSGEAVTSHKILEDFETVSTLIFREE